MAAILFIPVFRARSRFNRSQAAAEIEAHFPELGQRLRTVVDYVAPGAEGFPAAPGLLKALGRDTDHRSAGLDFQALVPWARFERRAIALFFAAAVATFALFASPGLRTASLRMLLFPVHYTDLKVEPGDVTLAAGDELKLSINLTGRAVDSVRWFHKNTSDRDWTAVRLGGNGDKETPARPLVGSLSTGLKNCQADLDYRVVAGELESPVFHVKVIHPLRLEGIEAAITPPAYTRRSPQVVKEGSFKAIEGSTVRLAVTLDHSPASASLVLASNDGTGPQALPLEINGAKLTAPLPPITKDLQYHIDAVDAEGMKLEPRSFRITLILDQKPTIRFIKPDESLAVTPTGRGPDRGRSGRRLRGEPAWESSTRSVTGPRRRCIWRNSRTCRSQPSACLRSIWKSTRSTFGMRISYYAFVQENHPNEPHRVVSELRFIDILPLQARVQVARGRGGIKRRLAEPGRADRTPASEPESHVRAGARSIDRSSCGHETGDVRGRACRGNGRVCRRVETERSRDHGAG